MSLPNGWSKCLLGDYLFIKNGFAFKSKDYLEEGTSVVRISDINNQKVSSIKTVKVAEDNVPEGFELEYGDLLIAMSGATTGKTGVYLENSYAVQNQRVGNIKLKSKNNGDAIFRNFLIQGLNKTIFDLAYGGAQPNISPTVLENIEIVLPPLNEQKQIAKKLDELLDTVESIKTRLDNAPKIIKRFHQSILTAATSGRLTEEWRKENKISKEWDELTVNDVAKVGTGNTPLKSNKSFYENADIPWLTSSVTGSSYVKEADKFVSQTAIDECRLKLYDSGTLLVAMYGEGKTRGQVTELTFPASINQACAAIMIDEEKIEKSYLKMRLQENYAEIRMLAEGGNQPNLNLSKVRSITVPIPTREEQKEIVSQVESLFTLADTLEEKIEAAKKRVDKLTQSILAKAFRGELVPQDPNDEPAEELLKRIKAEQEKEKPKKPRKKRTNGIKSKCLSSSDLIRIIAKKFNSNYFTIDDIQSNTTCGFDDLTNYLFELIEDDLIVMKIENNQKMYKIS